MNWSNEAQAGREEDDVPGGGRLPPHPQARSSVPETTNGTPARRAPSRARRRPRRSGTHGRRTRTSPPARRTARTSRARRGSRACGAPGTTRARVAPRPRSSPSSRSRRGRRRPSRSPRCGARPPGTHGAPRRSPRRRPPIARAAAVAAAAFSRLWAPRIRGSAGSGSSAANSTRRATPGTAPNPRGTIATSSSSLALERAELCGRVGVERAVPVEVVGLEVRQHGDARPQRVDVLELERGELAHDPGVGVERRRRATSAGGRCCPRPRPARRPPRGSRRGALWSWSCRSSP